MGSLTSTQVDEVYFKVHRDLLARTSGLVRDMLTMPVAEGQTPVEGTTMENAIVIPDVPYHHFEAILHAAYGQCVTAIVSEPIELLTLYRFVAPYLDPTPTLVLRLPGDVDDSPGVADLVGLLRTAHRLQASSVVVSVAQVLLPCLEPDERFAFCTELGLDDIRSTSEQEHQAESLRAHTAVKSRNERRGMHCRLGHRYTTEPPKLAAKQWLMEAFIAVVREPRVKMPSSKLGDKIGLHVMLARERLAELRILTVNKWILTKASYNRGDIICASNIWKLKTGTLRDWYFSTEQTRKPSSKRCDSHRND